MVLFCGSTAAGAVRLRGALGAARRPLSKLAGSACHDCQLGAPFTAPTAAHPPTLPAAASSSV